MGVMEAVIDFNDVDDDICSMELSEPSPKL